LAIRDVETCRLGQRVGDIRSADLCVVVNDARVILGDIRGDALHASPDKQVEEVMDPAPSTYRPNISVHQMAHQLAESDAKRVLISDGDGRLIGLLRREDVEAAR
jgi:predicted transcriptional regulator